MSRKTTTNYQINKNGIWDLFNLLSVRWTAEQFIDNRKDYKLS